jgi:Zn-dependent protease with chaperone function
MRGMWIAVWLLALTVGGARPAEARIVSRSAEVSVGRETASLVEQYFTVDVDPVALARVRQIGRRLTAHVKDVDFPFEFHVIESSEVNAFALPGGFIYVFRGLLQLVPNDDALAFVMAHEITHVTRRHAVRQFEKNVLLSAGITAILAGTGAGGGFGAAADVAKTIAGLSFTRSDEKEADEHGMDLYTRAGYNPKSAAEAMEVVKRAIGEEKGVPALLRSHPLTNDRIKKLNQLAAEYSLKRDQLRKEAPAPPPPPPTSERKLSGLDAVEVAPCEWLPLVTGARWRYRVRGEGLENSMAVRAIEPLSAEPQGVFRVEYDLGRGVKTLRLVAPAGDRYLSRAEGGDDASVWRMEAVFAPGDSVKRADGLIRFAATEKVSVPAGDFEAARVEKLDAEGKLDATFWYAKGVGLVKRTSAQGVTQELVNFHIPR